MGGEFVPLEVLAAFCKNPGSCTVTPLGSGNINDTYLVRSISRCFVLQRINSDVFPEPLRVVENFQKITTHLINKKDANGRRVQVAVPVLTLDYQLCYSDSQGATWRGQSYVPHTSRRVLVNTDQAYRVGDVLAAFHRLIRDLDVHGFGDPLPGFHDLPRYLEGCDHEMRNLKNIAGDELRFCVAAVERYRHRATILEKAKQSGILSLQPIHGDPKVDNFIYGEDGEVPGLLDLDTVAMGLVHFDLGDCLRSCCNRLGETGEKQQPISFDMTFCRAFLDGYFSGPDDLLSKEQRTYIFDGVLLICFELGVRFFTDHLRGNPYFKVRQAGDNLRRAVNQFRLADAIAEQEQEIRALVVSSGCR